MDTTSVATDSKIVEVKMGVKGRDKKAIADGLSRVLADTYTLYLMTHRFHWNVTGPMFGSLHAMFEVQYTELALAVDLIAERIRTLGSFAPGSFREFTELTSIKDEGTNPKAEEMVRLLAEANEAVVATLNETFALPDGADDQATIDLITQRLVVHEKVAWMLRSIIS